MASRNDPRGWRLPEDRAERDLPFWPCRNVSAVAPALRDDLGLSGFGVRVAVELYRAHWQGRALSYSRAARWYDQRSNLPQGVTWRTTVRAFDSLETAGLIIHFRQAPGTRGHQSSASATPALAEAVERAMAGRARLPLMPPTAAVILRNAAGADVRFPNTRETGRMARQVETLNEAIMATDIRTADGTDIAAPTARVFNVDFRHGGRLYCQGLSWQVLPAAERKRVTIDGEPVVEIDYRAMHVALLYAEGRATMPAGDAYDVGPGWPRDLVKIGMLAAVNAPNVHSARGAVAWHDRMAPLALPGSQAALTTAQALLDALRERHRAIAGAFFSGAGLRLMRQDSDIALAVAGAMLQRGIVVLPVHDSFLVPASKAEELEAQMLRTAAEIGLPDMQVRRS